MTGDNIEKQEISQSKVAPDVYTEKKEKLELDRELDEELDEPGEQLKPLPFLATQVSDYKYARQSDEKLADKENVKNQLWRLRYGVCLYEESCTKLHDQLLAQGIESKVSFGKSSMEILEAIFTGWESFRSAKEVKETLKAYSIDATLKSYDGKNALVSKIHNSKKSKEQILKLAEKLNYNLAFKESNEPINVYKVYGNQSFTSKESALRFCNKLVKQNLDCKVELLTNQNRI